MWEAMESRRTLRPSVSGSIHGLTRLARSRHRAEPDEMAKFTAEGGLPTDDLLLHCDHIGQLVASARPLRSCSPSPRSPLAVSEGRLGKPCPAQQKRRGVIARLRRLDGHDAASPAVRAAHIPEGAPSLLYRGPALRL